MRATALYAPPPPEWWALPDRLRLKIDPEAGTCWPWTGALDRDGYPLVRWEGKTRRAHRVVFVLLHGPIPPGFEVDHRCRVRRCVAPDHLEAVPKEVNLARRTPEPVRGQLALPFEATT